ncbi:c-type cytochrome [Chloroflexi bacterium TSY]|nr:c-type cytochrome [Chloroflexi bacterium TSY]
MISLGTVDLVDNEKLPPDVLIGKRIFYNAQDRRMNRDGYISCASCHLDAQDDGRIWDRAADGEGLRNTISLLGRGGIEHGNLHWTANFDEVQDFEHDMRVLFGGTGFLDDAVYNSHNRNQPLGGSKAGLSQELDALAAYVTSLKSVHRSPHRNPDSSLTAAGVAGRELFLELRCAACHHGNQFTDSVNGLKHDVGTISRTTYGANPPLLVGLDTPTLRGIWESAPYLHDGSAHTLLDVLTTKNLDRKHGDLQGRTQNELDNLVAYLLQIDDLEPGIENRVLIPALTATALSNVNLSNVGSPNLALRSIYSRNEKVQLTVTTVATDTQQSIGPIASIEFYIDKMKIAEDRQPPFMTTWRPTAQGNYLVDARITYQNNIQTILKPLVIRIGEGTKPTVPGATTIYLPFITD